MTTPAIAADNATAAHDRANVFIDPPQWSDRRPPAVPALRRGFLVRESELSARSSITSLRPLFAPARPTTVWLSADTRRAGGCVRERRRATTPPGERTSLPTPQPV